MNDIDILEEYFNRICFDETNKITADLCTIGIDEIRAIENLIQENKKLKDINFRMAYNTIKNEEIKLDNYIEKSKVEELKDKIHRELEINAVTRRDLIYIDLNLARIDKYFNDLLGKE